MRIRNVIFPMAAGGVLLAGAAFAAEPALDINPRLHPNLAEAQRLSRQAYNEIDAAQHLNGYDMEGHAKKAKELLDRVNAELKFAAEAANRHRRR